MTSVLPTGPPSTAGLGTGDIIPAIDGVEAGPDERLTAAIEAAGAGSIISLTIRRGRGAGDLEVVVAERGRGTFGRDGAEWPDGR